MNFNNDNIIIVVIINAIVKLNYIFSIMIVKNNDYRKKRQNNLNKIVKSLFFEFKMVFQNAYFKNAYFETVYQNKP